MQENWNDLHSLAKLKEEELLRDVEKTRLVREATFSQRTNIIPFHYPLILRLARFFKRFGRELEVKYEKKLKQKACA